MMSQGQKSLSVLRAAFREYYFSHSEDVVPPDRVAQREFGYTRLGERGMVRHLSFENAGALRAELVREVPSDVYCSNAIYREPRAPMAEKGWLGASLIFDIDAKDLDLPCVQEHTYHVCEKCEGSVSETDLKLNKCHNCGNAGLLHTSIPCAKCIKASKKEVGRLKEFLTKDIGIASEEMSVFFSGNNGFHIQVNGALFEPLESPARADLASYLLGRGILPESLGVIRAGGNAPSIRFRKSLLEYGWRERISKKLDLGSSTKLGNLVEQFGGYSGFKEYLQQLTSSMGVKIDPQVTSDVHRIFRTHGTINGKSSLVKVACTNLEMFEPFEDACLLGDSPITVKPKCPVQLRLRRKLFRLSREEAEIPAFAAAYLICKGLATAV